MGRELFIGAGGGIRALAAMDVLANNLANASTPGFKADRAVFGVEAPRNPGPGLRGADEQRYAEGYATLAESVADLRQGPMETTGEMRHVALSGEGFLRLRTADGETALTRDGRLDVDAEGRLVAAADGALVLGEDGEGLTVGQGLFKIDDDGTVRAGDRVAGKLALVRVAEASGLKKLGGSRFAEPADTEAGSPAVVQGALEGSNVEPVSALVELMALTRWYEAFQRTATEGRELDRALTDRVGRLNE